MMPPAIRRNLLLRANRHLGAALVDANLLTVESLETANARLLELAATGNARQSTVLGILAYELKVLREEDVLQHIADEHSAGLIDLRGCEVSDDFKNTLDLGACWATWTLPLDREEGFNYVATASYMSESTRAFWEKHLDGPIIWYGTTLEMIADALEKL